MGDESFNMKYNRFKVLKYDFKCTLLLYLRAVENLFVPGDNKSLHLFILSPPYAGSTLLHEIISTSPEVSPDNIWGTREGLSLPGIRELIDYRRRWDPEYKYPFDAIFKKLKKYWSRRKSIWLDKSPSFIFRATDIESYLPTSKFVILVRHPLALVNSFMVRDKMDLESAAAMVVKSFKFQYANCKTLNDQIWISYESLVNNHNETMKSLLNFIPEFIELPGKKKYKAHNQLGEKMGLTDFNQSKIKSFSEEDLNKLKDIFSSHQQLLDYFGYSI